MDRDHPRERAFVVQFGSETAPDRNRYVGRVEHVSTGRALRFQDLESLLGFLAAAMSPPVPPPPREV